MKKTIQPFNKKILDLVKKIPKGRVTTYLEIAKKLGNPGLARAVGNSLNKNPHFLKIPCHRVIKSNGEVGGFALGTDKKLKYLRAESVIVRNGRVLDFEELLYKFN